MSLSYYPVRTSVQPQNPEAKLTFEIVKHEQIVDFCSKNVCFAPYLPSTIRIILRPPDPPKFVSQRQMTLNIQEVTPYAPSACSVTAFNVQETSSSHKNA